MLTHANTCSTVQLLWQSAENTGHYIQQIAELRFLPYAYLIICPILYARKVYLGFK
jgi:hypothetical protein